MKINWKVKWESFKDVYLWVKCLYNITLGKGSDILTKEQIISYLMIRIEESVYVNKSGNVFINVSAHPSWANLDMLYRELSVMNDCQYPFIFNNGKDLLGYLLDCLEKQV